jgi:hypothetical protein
MKLAEFYTEARAGPGSRSGEGTGDVGFGASFSFLRVREVSCVGRVAAARQMAVCLAEALGLHEPN